MPEKEKKHGGKNGISRREFLGKSLKTGAGVAAASVASRFIGGKYSPHSIFASKEGEKMEYTPKAGLASGMIGGPTGFEGAERYQYSGDEAADIARTEQPVGAAALWLLGPHRARPEWRASGRLHRCPSSSGHELTTRQPRAGCSGVHASPPCRSVAGCYPALRGTSIGDTCPHPQPLSQCVYREGLGVRDHPSHDIRA